MADIHYAPCFSDMLMDEEILKCDIAFGVADPVFSFKESPSHQSDSGCSDMSEDRSVSPASFLSPVDEGLFDFDSVQNVQEMDEFSEELESYLANPVKNVDISSFSNLLTPELPKSEEIATASRASSSPEINVDDEDDDPDYQPESRVIQSKARIPTKRVNHPNASVIKVPASSTSANDSLRVLSGVKTSKSSGKNPPAIKVVKVVKTSAKLKQDVDNQIIEALDERNKKNAVQAKINREKKKAYVKSLEDQIDDLKSENVCLKQTATKAEQERQELAEEVAYLKSVLANQSAISGLLKNIGNVENVKLTSSINRKRGSNHDHDYGSSKRSRTSAGKTAGVCLHVDQGTVSLEFCSKCASMAKCTEQNGNV